MSLALARSYYSDLHITGFSIDKPIDLEASFRSSLRSVSLSPRAESSGESSGLSTGQRVAYGILIPILVVLSGIFAGLTLGYMSLDETQLQVLTAQGTARERKDAAKIVPVRKDGHLLLTTLLIANMITNETLPIVADPLLGGGVQAVIVSIVLVVIFAELIPQSVCSRYGLRIGASMALFTRCVMIVLWPIAWPVSRVLHYTLGPHQGTVYRRVELKELVTMHAATGGHGGDLKGDTVAIVGGALDMQEKVAKEAMTPIDRVHMIPITAKLDFATLETIVRSGHSRIPVYQDVETSLAASGTWTPRAGASGAVNMLSRTFGLRSDSTGASRSMSESGEIEQHPLVGNQARNASLPPSHPSKTVRRKILGALLVKQCVLLDPDDAVPPLLNVLNVFQEGRSHMAIVSPHSSVDAKSTVPAKRHVNAAEDVESGVTDSSHAKFLNMTSLHRLAHRLRGGKESDFQDPDHPLSASGTLPPATVEKHNKVPNAPLGIITLEDVLEELIGEEILDEYDSAGENASVTCQSGLQGETVVSTKETPVMHAEKSAQESTLPILGKPLTEPPLEIDEASQPSSALGEAESNAPTQNAPSKPY
ncbi:hypothetical protein MPSI1_000264 [Malassezia psittaci]|uniref:CNNM transmembrane domain-containing protein n=1 Tax=Malassezia psittaci TaxID=1821823 RepID=A0AAF0FAZ4_9BASI|nr:hypothetical protein MPSI1_000264 [Malassezia psittaci]